MKDTYQIELPAKFKVSEIKSILEQSGSQVSQDNKPSLKIWILDVRQPCLGALPSFFPYELHAEKALPEVPHFTGGCRFWIAGPQPDVLRQIMDNVANADPQELLRKVNTDIKEESATAEPLMPNLPAEERPATDGQPQEVNQEQTQASTEGAAPPPPPPPVEHSENGDTVMADSQETEAEPPPPPPPQMDASNENTIPPEPPVTIPERRVLCFLKVFSFEDQSLSNNKSLMAPMSANVLTELKKALCIESKQKSDDEMMDADSIPTEEWDIYHEKLQWTKSYELIDPSFNFEHYCISSELLPSDMTITIPSDGAVFIAQRRPSPEQYVHHFQVVLFLLICT